MDSRVHNLQVHQPGPLLQGEGRIRLPHLSAKPCPRGTGKWPVDPGSRPSERSRAGCSQCRRAHHAVGGRSGALELKSKGAVRRQVRPYGARPFQRTCTGGPSASPGPSLTARCQPPARRSDAAPGWWCRVRGCGRRRCRRAWRVRTACTQRRNACAGFSEANHSAEEVCSCEPHAGG